MIFIFLKITNYIKRNGFKAAIKKILIYIKILFSPKKGKYFWESNYQNDMDFSKYKTNVKAIAFYLPQFHAIQENDEWWGEGFTEWTNTRKAEPRFKDHYQPREPHDDIGYYDLVDVEILKKQAKLAKQHGIYGFCFYMYWFSGKRLLEKPLDLFLAHNEIDINFCLCWANENWTRGWDGLESEILIKQNYSVDDPIRFIEDIQKYIVDERYIKIDGKPVILVYNPGNIPDIRNVILKWKNHATRIGIGNINILVCKTFGQTSKSLNIEDIIDGLVDFPPHNIQIRPKNLFSIRKTGNIYDYKELVSEVIGEYSSDKNLICESFRVFPQYRTCMMGWDNTARKKSNWSAYAGFSLKCFYEWVSLLVKEALKTSGKIFFVNAWNEWAEGTYLEPDKKYGYATINTISKAIYDLPLL